MISKYYIIKRFVDPDCEFCSEKLEVYAEEYSLMNVKERLRKMESTYPTARFEIVKSLSEKEIKENYW